MFSVVRPHRTQFVAASAPNGVCVRLEKIDFHTADDFFNTYEHLGDCGLGVWHWAGFEGDRILGVVSFGTTCFARSRGHLSALSNEFDLSVYQICRGGTIHTAPRNTPSQILSCGMRELRRDRGDCLIVAYSDRHYNEVGTIYQACNGLYTGQTRPKDQANYIINGRALSGWVVRKRYGTRAMDKLRNVDEKVVKIPLTPKYRYVFVQAPRRVKAKVLARLRPFIFPYPNRESESIQRMNVASLVHQRLQHGACSVKNDSTSLAPTLATVSAAGEKARASCSGPYAAHDDHISRSLAPEFLDAPDWRGEDL